MISRLHESPRPGNPGLHVPAELLRHLYRAIFLINAWIIFVTALSDFGIELPRGWGQFDLKLESNAAAWYSSMLLLAGGGAASVLAFHPPPPRVSVRWHQWTWLIVACCFAALSLDEMTEIHERIGTWFSFEYGPIAGLTQGGAPVFGWLAVFAPGIALFVFGAVRMAWACPYRPSRIIGAVALGCWVGAIGSEFIEAQLARRSLNRGPLGATEEGLEVMGSALFFVAMCELLRLQSTRSLSVARASGLDTGADDPATLAPILPPAGRAVPRVGAKH